MKCKNCGKKIPFTLACLCKECLTEMKAKLEEDNYKLSVERNKEELKLFEQGKNTVVMTNGHMEKEYLIKYAEEHGYEAHNISTDGEEIPILTLIFKKTSLLSEWKCQYCETVNESNFCSNCGASRKA